MITGSLGMLPSASLGEGGVGLYEPVHGSAPDIAGLGVINPTAQMLSSVMMLDHLGQSDVARRIEAALHSVYAAGAALTPDQGGTASTAQFTEAVVAAL